MLDLLRLSMGPIQNGDIAKPIRRLAGALSMRFQHSDAAYQSVDMLGNVQCLVKFILSSHDLYPAHRRAVGMQVAAFAVYDGQGTKKNFWRGAIVFG